MYFDSREFTLTPGGISNGVTGGFKDKNNVDHLPPYHVAGADNDWRWGEQWLPHASWYLPGDGEWRRPKAVRVGREAPLIRLPVERRPALCSVAAGVMLRRDQQQPWAGRSWFRLRRAAEGRQDGENRDIRRDNADSKRSDDGYAENDRHEERNHGQPILSNVACLRHGWTLGLPAARVPNLTRVDALRC
jgi:hypothetical protein